MSQFPESLRGFFVLLTNYQFSYFRLLYKLARIESRQKKNII